MASREFFSSGTQLVDPSGQDSSILPAWLANHSAGFSLSCTLTELAMYCNRQLHVICA